MACSGSMKQRGIAVARYVPPLTEKRGFALIARCGVRRGARGFEASDQIVELQLFQALADGIQLAGGVLDQFAAFLDQLERFAQARLVGIEATDDRLEPLDGGLISALLSGHRHPSLARRARAASHPPFAGRTSPPRAPLRHRRAARHPTRWPARSRAPGFAAGRARSARP